MNFNNLDINENEVFELKTFLANTGYFLYNIGFCNGKYIEEYINKFGKVIIIYYKKNINVIGRYRDIKLYIHNCNLRKLKINLDNLIYTDYLFSIKVSNCRNELEFQKVMKEYIEIMSCGNIKSFLTNKNISILANAGIGISYEDYNIKFHYITYIYSTYVFQNDFVKVLNYKDSLIKEA